METQRVGRPRKYGNEKLLATSLYLPMTTDAYLEDLCAKAGKSRNEYLIFLIASADQGLANNLMARFGELSSLLRDNITRNKEMSSKLEALEKKYCMPASLFGKLQSYPEIEEAAKEFVQDYREKFARMDLKDRGDYRKLTVDRILERLRERAAKENKALIRENLARLLASRELAKYE